MLGSESGPAWHTSVWAPLCVLIHGRPGFQEYIADCVSCNALAQGNWSTPAWPHFCLGIFSMASALC